MRGPGGATSLRPPKRIIAPANKSVMFSLDAPESRQVAVAGAFNGWEPQEMVRGVDGVWRLTVLLPTGTHAYRFLVDGSWMPDPNNSRRQANDLGGHDSVCTVM